ncbi:MAG: alpha-1,2-fucosyltransferase [Bacteroidetes bacterium]|nr:alpha-1,2-fucosyltransferase [Bacteroidota bacterium]
MIITRLKGGLGNQMFQYATAKSLSLKKKTSLKLDTSFLNERPLKPNYTIRNYELGLFNINAEIANSDDIRKILNRKISFFDIIKIKFNRNSIANYKKPIIQEQGFQFDQNLFKSSENCLIVGYWQSEKYFDDIRPILLKDFSLKSEPDENNVKLLKNISTANSVSIHFRRGDYVSNPLTNQIHGVCNIEYYQKAIEFINHKVKDPVAFIFSDDIEWAKKNFKTNIPIIFVDKNTSNLSEDFRLMSACKHNIIANSSFSWWGAWLNGNPDKIVIAPEKWFADVEKNKETVDLVPEKWIRI